MKKLMLAVLMSAFAIAVQAGNGTCSEGSCCSKTKTSTVTKSECPMAKQQAKARAHKATRVVSNKVLQSPKAVSTAG